MHLLCCRTAGEREAPRAVEDLGSACVPVAVGNRLELAAHQVAAALLVGEQRRERLDPPAQLAQLLA